MVDVVDPTKRSRMMAGIRSSNTKPEILVRRALHRNGHRFRLHRADLPGRPDIVLPRHRAAILVHGCFWHRHEGCRYCYAPRSNSQFWDAKFARNIERDARNRKLLKEAGWRVATVWECALRHQPDETVADLIEWLESSEKDFETAPVEARKTGRR